jgi:hypothetical protein
LVYVGLVYVGLVLICLGLFRLVWFISIALWFVLLCRVLFVCVLSGEPKLAICLVSEFSQSNWSAKACNLFGERMLAIGLMSGYLQSF